MTAALCTACAHTVAAVWAGLGWDMSACGNVILCADAAARIEPGCLSLRAVTMSGWAGLGCAALLRRAWPFPLALALGAAMSWLRVFALVALYFAWPEAFGALHGRCGYAAFSASLLCLIIAVATAQRKETT